MGDFKSIGQGIFQFCLGAASAVDILVEAIGHSLNWLPNNLDTGYLENFYFTVMTLGFLAFFYGMYALYLYKKSGGDYGLKCGIDVDAIEARCSNQSIEPVTLSCDASHCFVHVLNIADIYAFVMQRATELRICTLLGSEKLGIRLCQSVQAIY